MTGIEIIFKFAGDFESRKPRHQYVADDEISIVSTCAFQA